MKTLKLEHQGRVLVIELNRPEVLNAVDTVMRRELYSAFEEATLDPELGAVVLTGAGKSFCSGVDLKGAAANSDMSLRRTSRTLLHDLQPLIECTMRMDKPVIAAVIGAAADGGRRARCTRLVRIRTAALPCSPSSRAKPSSTREPYPLGGWIVS